MSALKVTRILAILLVIAVIVAVGAACDEGVKEELPETTEPTQTPTIQPEATPTFTPTATPTIEPVQTATPTEIAVLPTPFSGPKDVFNTDKLHVRSGPGLSYVTLNTLEINTLGVIIGGPEEADGYTWWDINWEDQQVDGWSAQDWLEIGKWPAVTECDLSKPIDLRRSDKFGIFGDDEFDTLVCGYVKFAEKEAWEERVTNAYLAIVDYTNPGFITSVKAGIEMGNSVNQIGPSYVELNLGCYKGGEIVGFQHEDEPYLDSETERAILTSSPGNLVSLVLSYGFHPRTRLHLLQSGSPDQIVSVN